VRGDLASIVSIEAEVRGGMRRSPSAWHNAMTLYRYLIACGKLKSDSLSLYR